MNDCRRMLRGDGEQSGAFAVRLRRNPKGCAVINYVTTHDGFTLEDLVSYDYKHNQANGEQDRDGTDYNYSWNCGVEGPTRKRRFCGFGCGRRKTRWLCCFLRQGVPMLLAGDEFGNTQDGNNNPYCHDSELTWLGWNQSKSTQQLHHFGAVRYCLPEGTSDAASGDRASVCGPQFLRLSWICLTTVTVPGTVIFHARRDSLAVCMQEAMPENPVSFISHTIYTGQSRRLRCRFWRSTPRGIVSWIHQSRRASCCSRKHLERSVPSACRRERL